MAKEVVRESAEALAPVADGLRPRFGDVGPRAPEVRENRAILAGEGSAAPGIPDSPSAEWREADGAYLAEVASPGFTAGSMCVIVAPDEIVVHAYQVARQHDEGGKGWWTEAAPYRVHRRLRTPAAIDAERTTATLQQGILRIVAPKGGPEQRALTRSSPTA